jgi:membrane fusion protein (multidrug efflux system)
MIRKVIVGVLIVLVVVGALAGVKALQIKKLIDSGKSFAPPPETVSTTEVREDRWRTSLTSIGSITAVQGVNLTPDLPGIVREIAFESGTVVKAGDLLVRLDTSAEEAQLRAIEAQLELARLNLARVAKLRQDNTVSEAELDAAQATLKQNEGNADAVRAAIAKKTIRAPFGGQLGIRLINLGQYLEAGKPIVSLQSLAPVHADFSLPQQELAQLKVGMSVRLQTDAYPGRSFEGTLTAINPDLDVATRSIGLQATLANPDQALRPGMFAKVEVLLPDEQNVLVIPATAVLSAPYGDSVYVVETKPGDNSATNSVVRQQFVRTGRARGDYLVVENGLKQGEKIVSSGVFKLRNGMAVVENNALAPKTSATPQPADS